MRHLTSTAHERSRASSPKKASTSSAHASRPIFTTAQVLPDGVVDVTRDPDKGDAWKLVMWRKSSLKQVARLEYAGQIFAPSKVRSHLAKALALPTCPKPYGSTHALFDEVLQFLDSAAELLPNGARLASYWVLANWFWDAVPTAPCLFITGPHDEALWLLRALAAVSYHSLLIGNLTPAGFRLLPMHLHLTLVVDEGEMTANMARLMLASNN